MNLLLMLVDAWQVVFEAESMRQVREINNAYNQNPFRFLSVKKGSRESRSSNESLQ